MKNTKALFASSAAIAALVLASPASADEKGSWSFKVKGGIAEAISGDVHRGPSFDGSALLALEPGSLPVDVDAKGFDDVYGTFTDLALESHYTINEKTTWFVGLSRTEASGGTLQVGTVAGSLPLMGTFGDYDDTGLYTGIKYQFAPSNAWRPYVSADIGYRNVDAIDASFMVPDTPFVAPFDAALTNAPFYNSSDVFGIGLNLGVKYQASETMQIGVETGARIQGSLDGNDSVLDVLGLGALNDEGDLTLMPFRIFANWEF